MAGAHSHSSPAVEANAEVRESGRQRARRACDPCKARKRRCDGNHPCSSCTRYEYDCTYATRRKKRTPRVRLVRSPSPREQPRNVSQTNPPDLLSPQMEDRRIGTNGMSMEANSSVAFPHLLGLKLNPSNAPKVQGFGWNVGNHYQHTRSERSITWIISKSDWHSLFEVYMREIHCLYGFLNTEYVLSVASKRWEDPKATNSDDHVLCGVAALAALFSTEKANRSEKLLAECAKEILDSTSTLRDPTIHDAEAWVLRTLYLRCNSTPHAAWVASCTTLHMIEAAGIHQELSETSLLYPDSGPGIHDSETRRRLFWVAKLLNTWISTEYGRSRTVLQAASCRLPTALPNDYTTHLIELLQISEVLDPSRQSEPIELENSLLKVASFHFTLIPLVLSQSTLCFALYRRLRLATVRFKKDLLGEVISVGRKGLEASMQATQSGLPWWHVSNVPFQFACVILAMDSQESLSYLSQAITTLKTVVNHFKSAMAHQALATIERLVRLTQIRKQQDVAVLQECLGNSDVADQAWGLEDNMQILGFADGSLEQWSNDILWSTPALGEVDWDQFGAELFDFSAPNVPSR